MAIFGVKSVVFGQMEGQNSLFLLKTGYFSIFKKNDLKLYTTGQNLLSL
jgi:hypothetical protein